MNESMNTRRNAILKKFGDQDERQLREDVAKIMATPEGRRLFMAVCYHGGLYKFTQRDDNQAYVAGKRDAVLEFFKQVKSICPAEATIAQIERDKIVVERNRELQELKPENE